MRHYKDTTLDQHYRWLLNRTPEELLKLGVFGATYHSFKGGYEGKPKPHFIVRNTFNFVAYMAGKDSQGN